MAPPPPPPPPPPATMVIVKAAPSLERFITGGKLFAPTIIPKLLKSKRRPLNHTALLVWPADKWVA